MLKGFMLIRAVAVASVCFPAMASRSAAQVSPELRAAMQARLRAVWSKDSVAWDSLTAPEFTVVVPEGQLLTKAERLVSLRAETPEEPHALQRETIHLYGETAVHRFLDGTEWVLEIWARANHVWRVVAVQVNLAAR